VRDASGVVLLTWTDVLQSVSLSVSGIRFPDRQIDSGVGANRTCALLALRRGVERDVDEEFD